MADRMQYNELCPKCLESRLENKLFLDLEKVQIQCELGHTYEELPSDSALRTGQESVANRPDVKPENPPDSEAGAPSNENEAINTLEEPQEPEVSQAEGEARLAQIATEMQPQVPLPASAPVAEVAVKPPQPPIGWSVREGQAVTLPNGDLLLGVKIPEAWRQAVEAEAEAQLKSPAKYFADWLTSDEMQTAIIELLQNYWTSAYSQTI